MSRFPLGQTDRPEDGIPAVVPAGDLTSRVIAAQPARSAGISAVGGPAEPGGRRALPAGNRPVGDGSPSGPQLISGLGGDPPTGRIASAGPPPTQGNASSPLVDRPGRGRPPTARGGDRGPGARHGGPVVGGIRPGMDVPTSPVVGEVVPVVTEASAFPGITPGTPPAPVPIRFLENRDQGDPAARFVASTRSLTASFEEHAIGLQLGGQQQDLVRLEFEGASAGSRLVGEGSASDPGRCGRTVPPSAASATRGCTTASTCGWTTPAENCSTSCSWRPARTCRRR